MPKSSILLGAFELVSHSS